MNQPTTIAGSARYCGCDPAWFADYVRPHLPGIPTDIHAEFEWSLELNQLILALLEKPLAAFHLANFKAYGPTPQRFPIAPITLLFGPNSAGKSSLLQAMLYVGHAIEKGDLSPRYLKGAGTTIDLGKWRDWVHGKDEDAVVQFGFEFSHLRRAPGKDTPPTQWWVALRHGRILSATLHHNGHELLHFIPDSNKREIFRCVRANVTATFFQSLASEIPPRFELHKTPWSDWPESDRQTAAKTMLGVLEKSELKLQGLVPDGFSAPDSPADSSQSREVRLANECRAETSRFLDHVAGSIRGYFKSIDFLSSQRVAPGRDFENLDKSSLNYWHNGGIQWANLAEYEEVRDEINQWFARLHGPKTKPRGLPYLEFSSVSDFNAIAVESAVEGIAHDYLTERQNAHEEDKATAENDKKPEEDRKAAADRVAFPFDQMDASEITKRVMAELAKNRRAVANRHLVIRDKSKRSTVLVTPTEIGVGPQYLVPVMVHTMEGGGRVKIIEEPEQHLHPAMQVEFADFAIRHAFNPRKATNWNNQSLIFETHSEHFVLRMLRRIRESSEGAADYPEDYIPKIRPDQIAVVYTEPRPDGTVLRHLKITADGDFIDRWPAGFFTERADELF